MAELVERVGGVGDELAEEDLRVRVERMDDELEELADFGLELLLGHVSIMAKKGREMKMGFGAALGAWGCIPRLG